MINNIIIDGNVFCSKSETTIYIIIKLYICKYTCVYYCNLKFTDRFLQINEKNLYLINMFNKNVIRWYERL